MMLAEVISGDEWRAIFVGVSVLVVGGGLVGIGRAITRWAASAIETVNSLNGRVEQMDHKFDEFVASNHRDHAEVQRRLGDVETRLAGVEAQVERWVEHEESNA